MKRRSELAGAGVEVPKGLAEARPPACPKGLLVAGALDPKAGVTGALFDPKAGAGDPNVVVAGVEGKAVLEGAAFDCPKGDADLVSNTLPPPEGAGEKGDGFVAFAVELDPAVAPKGEGFIAGVNGDCAAVDAAASLVGAAVVLDPMSA